MDGFSRVRWPNQQCQSTEGRVGVQKFLIPVWRCPKDKDSAALVTTSKSLGVQARHTTQCTSSEALICSWWLIKLCEFHSSVIWVDVAWEKLIFVMFIFQLNFNIVGLALQVWERNLFWETWLWTADCNVESCQYTVCCSCMYSRLELFITFSIFTGFSGEKD